MSSIALDNDREQPAVVDAQDIEIDLGEGLWIYRGNVTIQQGTLQMIADEIRLFFEGDVLKRAIASGQPAIFEQKPEGSDYFLKGRAQNIEIDESENIAIFSGNAKLQQYRDVITGETIIYHMKTQKITVRGNISTPGQTTRLSTSAAEKNEVTNSSELSTRPKVIIQSPSDDAAFEPSIVDISDSENEESSEQRNDRNITETNFPLGEDSLKFQAARIVVAGTGVYNTPSSTGAFLGSLSGQIPVKVNEIHNDWASVAIPAGINVWVANSYVQKNNKEETIIMGHGVRARWLPSTQSRVIGVFKSGERVRVLVKKDNWSQVVLPPSMPAWIPINQLEILDDADSLWHDDWTTHVSAQIKIENCISQILVSPSSFLV